MLRQTYANFELIVVSDASPDQTSRLVEQIDDPRLTYIVHERNRGSDKARHTGLQASSGEIIAFLDQDDLFHPDKLQAHVDLYRRRPEVGFTYNNRFELNYSAETIRDIWRPPQDMTIADLVLWFPLSPSDVVLRREWALEMDLLDGGRGSEITHFGRLFLAGCPFAGIDRALNYRRYHARRRVGNLTGSCEAELHNQARVLTDPRLPPDVRALRPLAEANLYLYWGTVAFAQAEVETGRQYLRQAVQRNPRLLEGEPCELMTNFLINAIDDEGEDHEAILAGLREQLPADLSPPAAQFTWAAAQGCLLKGMRAALWDRLEDSRRHFARAAALGGRVDDYFLANLTRNLLTYEGEMGSEAAQAVLERLAPALSQLGGRAAQRRLKGSILVNRAFDRFHSGEHRGVPRLVMNAIWHDPAYLINRGVLAVLWRSAAARRSP